MHFSLLNFACVCNEAFKSNGSKVFLNVYSDWARAVEAKSQMLFPTDLGGKR